MKDKTAVQVAREDFNSTELVLNPYETGTTEHREYADELMRLSMEAGDHE